jgi:hypothetical protein
LQSQQTRTIGVKVAARACLSRAEKTVMSFERTR